MANGADMIANHYFPKVTHCDFKIRELGNDHLYTVQCILSINIFTEKIYIILWFWFVILTVLTVIDLILFLFRNGLSSQRNRYVKKHVEIFSKLNKEEHGAILAKFSNKFLKPDVVLVLKIIATNVNGIVVSELIKDLWDSYYKKNAIAPLKPSDQQNPNNYDNEDLDDKDGHELNDYDDNLTILDKNGSALPRFPSANDNLRTSMLKNDAASNNASITKSPLHTSGALV